MLQPVVEQDEACIRSLSANIDFYGNCTKLFARCELAVCYNVCHYHHDVCFLIECLNCRDCGLSD